jgi:hypothetical protein
VAVPGDVVEVRAGAYGGQNVNVTPKVSGPEVVFRPAAGAAVTVSSIDVTRGSYIEFRDFTVNASTYNRQEAQHITYRRVKMRQFFIRGSDHIRYLDGEVDGPDSAGQEGMNWITEPYQSSDPATDILFDGMDIHDFRKFTSGAHIDCIGIGNVDGVTIRNSRIWQCAHFAIIFGTDPSGRYTRNLLIENNFIDCCDRSGGGFYSIGLGDGDGVTIRHNSATLGFGWLNPNGDGVRNDVIDSNIISNNASANCSKATWRYNVVASGSACSQGVLAPTGFRQEPNDLHLTAGSAAIDFGNPAAGRPGRLVELRRDERDGGAGWIGRGQPRDGVGCRAGRRPVGRSGVELRRRQRPGDGAGFGVAGLDESDDARGVGAADGVGERVADGGHEGAGRRPGLRPVRRQRPRRADRPRPHRQSRHARGSGRTAAQRLDASGEHV